MQIVRVLIIILLVGLGAPDGAGVLQAGTSRFATLDGPTPASYDAAYGINAAGAIVGTYEDGVGMSHGFLLRQGHYTIIDDPEASSGGLEGTSAMGINTQGDVVGYYVHGVFPNLTLHGFLLRQGHYTTINDPAAGKRSHMGTAATGINAAGDIVGYYIDSGAVYHGFLLHRGRYTTLDDPEAARRLSAELPPGTMASGINAAGDIVGYYLDGGAVYHGFLLHRGRYTAIDDPMAPSDVLVGSQAHGINAEGDIVGFYIDDTDMSHGFLLHHGLYTAIDDPLAGSGTLGGTQVLGINPEGDIVGYYTDSGGTRHGFLMRHARQAAGGTSGGQEPAATPASTGPIFFSRDVEAILQAHCAACHIANNFGGLHLNSYAGLQAGGNIVPGPIFVAGNHTKSILWQITKAAPPWPGGNRMPLGGPYLSDSEIAKIAAWIDQGAKNN